MKIKLLSFVALLFLSSCVIDVPVTPVEVGVHHQGHHSYFGGLPPSNTFRPIPIQYRTPAGPESFPPPGGYDPNYRYGIGR